jgi:putative serine protease PepD
MGVVNKRTIISVAVALAIGIGIGAGVYAGVGGGSSTTSVTTVVPAQPAAKTQTISGLTQIYDDVTPGVVDITVVSSAGGGQFGFGGSQETQAEGTGFVYDSKGDIVTNAHVVAGASSIKVRFKNGNTVSAKLVGVDQSTDTAVIKVDVPASDLHPLTIGSSANVQPGQEVVAIGSPFGLAETMTAGIISAIDRTITAPNNFSISGAIQTDAPINHGNSGGPLLNTSGAVIGVNAQIDSDSGGNDGVGFALPIDTVKSVAATLIAGGKVEHAYLGIHVGDVADNGGAKVESVVSGSPADRAGVQVGDVITAVGSKSVTGADDLTAAVNTYAPGDKGTLTVKRNGSTKSLSITFGTRPSSS